MELSSGTTFDGCRGVLLGGRKWACGEDSDCDLEFDILGSWAVNALRISDVGWGNGAGSGCSYVACGGPWGGAWLHAMLCLCMLAMQPRSGLAVVAGWLVSHAIQPSEPVSIVNWLVVRCEGGLKLGMDLCLCRLACMCMDCHSMDCQR